MSTSIVTGSDSSKPLLSRCVPLQGKQRQLLQGRVPGHRSSQNTAQLTQHHCKHLQVPTAGTAPRWSNRIQDNQHTLAGKYTSAGAFFFSCLVLDKCTKEISQKTFQVILTQTEALSAYINRSHGSAVKTNARQGLKTCSD